MMASSSASIEQSAASMPKDKDATFIKKLFEASENHNKNLSELISILKKNLEEEKYKVSKLSKENTDLKRELQARTLSLQKAESDLSSSKAAEAKQTLTIKSLEEQLLSSTQQIAQMAYNSKSGDKSQVTAITPNNKLISTSHLHSISITQEGFDKAAAAGTLSVADSTSPIKADRQQLHVNNNNNNIKPSKSQLLSQDNYQHTPQILCQSNYQQRPKESYQKFNSYSNLAVEKENNQNTNDGNSSTYSKNKDKLDRIVYPTPFEISPSTAITPVYGLQQRSIHLGNATATSSIGNSSDQNQLQSTSAQPMKKDYPFGRSQSSMVAGSAVAANNTVSVQSFQSPSGLSYQVKSGMNMITPPPIVCISNSSNNNSQSMISDLDEQTRSQKPIESSLRTSTISPNSVHSTPFTSFQQRRQSISTVQKLSLHDDQSNSVSPLSLQYRLKAPPRFPSGSSTNIPTNLLKPTNMTTTTTTPVGPSPIYYNRRTLSGGISASGHQSNNPNSLSTATNTSGNNNYFTNTSMKQSTNEYDELTRKAFEAAGGSAGGIGSSTSIQLRSDQRIPSGVKEQQQQSDVNSIKSRRKGDQNDPIANMNGFFHRKRNSESVSSQSTVAIQNKEDTTPTPTGIFQKYSGFGSINNPITKAAISTTASANSSKRIQEFNSTVAASNSTSQAGNTATKIGQTSSNYKIEDVSDTIANVEEDADEAANLESLNGSHFKFNFKGSQKNIRINTEQYFSKIESPPLSEIKANYASQQQQQQPSENHNKLGLKLEFPHERNLFSELSNLYSVNPLLTAVHTPVAPSTTGLQQTNRLQTEEASKQFHEQHQSVETYNRINNKMLNFKGAISHSINMNLNSNFSSRGGSSAASFGGTQRSDNIESQRGGLERKIKTKSCIREQKEPGRLKQQLESSALGTSSLSSQSQAQALGTSSDYGSRLFEALMIYGPDQSQLSQLPTLSSNKVFNVKPSLYFKYPQSSEIEKGREDVFQQFAFPFGVETNQINLTNSLSQLNEIIFSKNMAEANNNCFVFAIKSEHSYQPQKSMCMPASSSLTSTQSISAGASSSLLPSSDHNELLDICNPSNLLYGICFRVKEVVQQGGQSKNCLVTNKLFCFLTYYPFHRFFLEVISSMLNQMKMKRIEYFSRIQENIRNDPSALKKLEFDFFENFLNQECIQLLEALKKIELPRLSRPLELTFNNERFVYDVPDRVSAKHIEAEWGCSLALQSFGKEMFVSIFLALLLEQSTVFVSANSALLSSTMLLFHSLLKPFKWHHPLVFNLPNEYMHLMDIPVPILVGLNKDKSYVYENKLYSKHENCMFVLLDDENPIELINIELTTKLKQSNIFKNLMEELSEFFDELDAVSDEENINKMDWSVQQLANSVASTQTKSSAQKRSSSANNYSHARSKSSIISVASDAIQSLLSNSKSNKQNHDMKSSLGSTAAAAATISSNRISISTHKRRKQIIAYPNQKEKQVCSSIIIACSQFLEKKIIHAMPRQQCLQTSNNLLDFEAIQTFMETTIGKNDPFLTQFIKTQLFMVFAEESYDSN